MFIDALKRQNPALISAAIALWQQGKIAPDSWVIDADQSLRMANVCWMSPGNMVSRCI